ncbi:MAG: hypothetical protein ACLFRG_06920 [Desulfococcaceae bacterium]
MIDITATMATTNISSISVNPFSFRRIAAPSFDFEQGMPLPC